MWIFRGRPWSREKLLQETAFLNFFFQLLTIFNIFYPVTYFISAIALFFWRLGRFLKYLMMVINRYLGQWLRKRLHLKPPPLCDILWKFEVNSTSDAPSTKSFIGNWIEVVHQFFIVCFFCFFFPLKKSLFYFYSFIYFFDWQRWTIMQSLKCRWNKWVLVYKLIGMLLICWWNQLFGNV